MYKTKNITADDKRSKKQITKTREAFLRIRRIERDLENGKFDDIDFFIQYSAKSALNYALEWAAFHGKFELVKKIIDEGANIHANDDVALQMACKNGHFAIVDLLVSMGADINASSGEPLSNAIINNHIDIVKYLINYDKIKVMENVVKMLPSQKNKFMIWVTNPNDMDINEFKIWIPEKLDININNSIALRIAVDNNLIDITKLLLEHGADRHVFDDYLFSIAERKGHAEILQLLKNY